MDKRLVEKINKDDNNLTIMLSGTKHYNKFKNVDEKKAKYLPLYFHLFTKKMIDEYKYFITDKKYQALHDKYAYKRNVSIKIEEIFKDVKKGNLYNPELIKRYKGIEYVQYDTLRFYKAMDGYYTKEDELNYLKSNKNTPIWYSSIHSAIKAVKSRGGGISAYCLKKNKKLNVFVVNCANILKLIEICKKILGEKLDLRGKPLRKGYLLDLLRLTSCSERGFADQIKLWLKIYFKGSDNAWLFDYNTTRMPMIEGDYFALNKHKGFHNYNFAYLIRYLNKEVFDDYFDGHILVNKYSPYYHTSETLEEIVIFNTEEKIYRDVNCKYDWYQYFDKLGITIPKNYKPQFMLSKYNADNELYRLYGKKFNSEHNIEIREKIIKTLGTSIVFLNCNDMVSTNVNDTDKIIRKGLENLISFVKADVYILVKAKNIKIPYNYARYNDKIIYRKDKKSDELMKVIENIMVIDGLHRKRRYQIKYEKFEMETDRLLNHFKKKAQPMQNILYITDSYIGKHAPEIDWILSKGYKHINLKTSFYDTDNCLFIKGNVKIQELVDYNKSYYLPLLVIIDNHVNY